ncbi:response regulator transcription factor [Blautia parvula]|uniref:Stage 0 sporulation protein A homolog n=2 Tax=Lachnospiraceae TaxID=186803 RepID=A0ABQ0BUA0_9FIRM
MKYESESREMIDLYYAEDDETVAQAVKEYLEQENFRVTVFSMLAGMKQALRSRQPDLVLLDWNMPDGQGNELCGWLRARWPWLPVIFLTVRGDSHDVVGGFQKGADDYVVKPFELEVLHSRILALLRRTGQVKVNCYHCDSLTLDMDKMSVFCDGEELVLSQPEYQILLLLMENKGKTVTRKQLLEKVWDSNGNYVNDNTLTVTIKRLREKLHQPACLKTIRSFGYRMEDTL